MTIADVWSHDGHHSQIIRRLVSLALLSAATWGAVACSDSSPQPTRPSLQPVAAGAPMASPVAAVAGSTGPNANAAMPLLPHTAAGRGAGAVQAGECKAGHYVGRFGGMYRTAVLANGSIPVPFTTIDTPERPGFEFWLRRVDKDCAGMEFCADFVVEGGKVRGLANPFADPNMSAGSDPAAAAGAVQVRFEIDLIGQLDCHNRQFKGTLRNGCYDVFSILYRFDGTITGEYAPSTHALEAGEWTAVEQPMDSFIAPEPNIGGSGTWSAAWRDDSESPIAPGKGLCDGQSGFDTP